MRAIRFLLPALCLCVSSQLSAAPLDDLAGETWIQAESQHFRIVTDQPEPTARLMLTDLETLRYISVRVRGAETLEGAPPLTILALGKHGNFDKLGLSREVVGMFSSDRHGYSALAEVSDYIAPSGERSEARTTLLHEYHHFLMRITPQRMALPFWYDEGTAEYWSSMYVQDGMAKFGLVEEGMGRVQDMFSAGGFLRVDTRTLFNTRDFKWNDTASDNEAISRFYAQAAYTVHFFLSTAERRAQLERYIELINQGISQDTAARLAFKLSYAELDKEVLRYLKHKMVVRGYKIGKDGLDIPEIAMRVTRLDRKAIYARFAQVLPRYLAHDHKRLSALLATNRQLNPDDPEAYRTHVLYVGGAGQAPLTELVARYPRDAGLHAVHGEALRLHGEALRATGADGWVAQLQLARQAFLRAYQLDQQQALTYSGLGEVHYALPGKDGLEDGLAAMDTGVIFQRTPESFRKLARMHLRAGNVVEAQQAMRAAVAFNEDAHADALDVALQENLELLAIPHGPKALATAEGLRWPDGSSYAGAVRGLLPHGAGRFTRVGGSYYEGSFENGLAHGAGKLVSERGVAFEGRFEAGAARGRGRLSVTGGGALQSYEGDVDYMVPSGAGVLVSDTGRYEGQLLDGEPHGTGTFTPAASATKLSGVWRFGLFDFPAVEKMLFTGPVNARGRREGRGWCRFVDKPQEPLPCNAAVTELKK